MLKTSEEQPDPSSVEPRLIAKVLRIEWLGQTVASICWITSVFVYGLSSPGDWLQLSAASAWLIANIAALGIVVPARALQGDDA